MNTQAALHEHIPHNYTHTLRPTPHPLTLIHMSALTHVHPQSLNLPYKPAMET